MAQMNSISTLTLDLPPSCIEFVPKHPEYFVIGTYNLEKQEQGAAEKDKSSENVGSESVLFTQQRNGTLVLLKLVNNEIQVIQTLQTTFAILDLHFNTQLTREESLTPKSPIWFCTANSTGSIASYQISFQNDQTPRIGEKGIFQLWDPKILVLAFAWNPKNPSSLGATLSTGEVVFCSADIETCVISSPKTISSHTLEAWTLAFAFGTNTVFSGGDDAVLKATMYPELRPKVRSDDGAASVVWENRKIHGAGVTAILPLSDTTVLTGSYDDYVRIINIDGKPKCVAITNLEGGVWRLRELVGSVDPQATPRTSCHDVLASCMHAGARILRISLSPTPTITVLAKFEEHKSMNYGSDVKADDRMDEYHIISTSFYDKLVCFWSFRP